MHRTTRLAIVSTVSVVVFSTCLTAALGADPPKNYTETVTGKTGRKISFDMVLIPGGKFVMGSPEEELGRKAHEGPRHEVQLDPFYLCTTETTLRLFLAYYEETVTSERDQQAKEQADENDLDAVSGPSPVYGDLTMGHSEKHPCFAMTWHNAMNFCKWLSMKTGKKYRLPTEAEWEYACRAGTTNVFAVTNDQKQLGDFAWHRENSDRDPHEVATKKPNPWGLYDMLGNVCEWVYDFYSPTAYAEAAKTNPAKNPTGPREGKVHVARGGAHDSPVEQVRSAARVFEEPWWRAGDPQIPKSKWWFPEMNFIGLRVARSAEPASGRSGKPAEQK